MLTCGPLVPRLPRRVWERYYLAHNSDVTCGVLANVGRLLLGHYELGVPSLNDLSPRSFLKSAVPMVHVDATWETPAALAGAQSSTLDFSTATSFKKRAKGKVRVTPSDPLLRADMCAELMDDNVIAYSGALFVQGEYRIVTNDVYSRVFMSTDECNKQLKEGQMLPTFVWAR